MHSNLMKVNKTVLFLSVIAFFCLNMGTKAQESDYKNPEDCLDRRGLEYGGVAGFYFAGQTTAGFYSGKPENENNVGYVFKNKYWYDEIYQLLGAVDTFFVPTQTSKRKSVFVAVTPQTALLNKIAMLEQCTLNVTSVSIAELALSELLQLNPNFTSAPCMVINASGSVCKIKIYFQNNLYLVRVLPLEKFLKHRDTEAYKDIVLEIQRSIDFGLMELKLSEPKNIVFTPGSQADGDLLSYLQSELRINVSLLDINAFFTSKRPINPSVISRAVYAIGGCLMTDGGKYDSVS